MQSPWKGSFLREQHAARDRRAAEREKGQMEAFQTMANTLLHTFGRSPVVQRIGTAANFFQSLDSNHVTFLERQRIHWHQSNQVRQGVSCTQHTNLFWNIYIDKSDADFKAYRRRKGRRMGPIFVDRSRKTFPSARWVQQDQQPTIERITTRNKFTKGLLTPGVMTNHGFYGDGTDIHIEFATILNKWNFGKRVYLILWQNENYLEF